MIHPFRRPAGNRVQVLDTAPHLHELALGEPAGNSGIRFRFAYNFAYNNDVVRFQVFRRDIRRTLCKDVLLPRCEKL